MKKLVLTSICTVAVASGALAQGFVNWTGPAANSYTTQTNSTQYSPLFGGGSTGGGAIGGTTGSGTGAGGFYFELLYTSYSGTQAAVPQTLTALATWSDAGLGGTNNPVTSSAGRNVVAGSTTAVTVPWASGTTESIMVVEWSANLGTSWATALASLQNGSFTGNTSSTFFGESNTGFISANPGNPGSVVFANATTANGTPILSLSTQLYVLPVPEPSTIAMAAFGGLSLLALRRKK
jgi:hypothetical protein